MTEHRRGRGEREFEGEKTSSVGLLRRISVVVALRMVAILKLGLGEAATSRKQESICTGSVLYLTEPGAQPTKGTRASAP